MKESYPVLQCRLSDIVCLMQQACAVRTPCNFKNSTNFSPNKPHKFCVDLGLAAFRTNSLNTGNDGCTFLFYFALQRNNTIQHIIWNIVVGGVCHLWPQVRVILPDF